MTLYEIMVRLEKMLDPAKFNHSMFTMQTAKELAGLYDMDTETVSTAAILHDCACGMSHKDQLKLLLDHGADVDETSRECPWILHGPAGRIVAQKEFSVYNADILNAICYHTYGREEMGTLEKIVMISDFTEPTRNISEIAAKQAEIRKEARKDLDEAVLMTLDSTISYLLENGLPIHANSIATRNWILIKRSDKHTGEPDIDK